MKNDIDSLMEKKDINALLVTGAGDHNPFMVYFTMGAHLTLADLVKPRGRKPVLFHGSMERDEAAKTGLETRSFLDYQIQDYMKKAGNDYIFAMALRYRQMLNDAGVTSGKVALYGQVDLGRGYAFFSKLQEIMPEITLVGYEDDDLLAIARMTKDTDELNRIRNIGKITTSVVAKTADYLSSRQVKGDVLTNGDGLPVTIGEVKARINLWLAEAGAENPEGVIFSIGRDAAVPHSSGNPDDILRLGETIVFDIFPCEQGGGYFYDLTRTWCLGYANKEISELYNQVRTVYDQVVSELKINARFTDYQMRTCDLFEVMGHPTIRKDPNTVTGYIHTLGHGVGLHVHERPTSSILATEADILAPGAVFTVEPGLYYPDKNMGVRLEDTLVVNEDGSFEVLADYPMDLVIPVKG